MLNCSLQRRRYFVLLALMLLLPVVSAFAYNNTFNVSVNSGAALPVTGAQVYVWDKNAPSTNTSGTTDANGNVTLVLPGLTATADSLTSPSPNIGFLAIPVNGATGTLAFATAETLYYNFFGTDGIASPISIDLNPGCQLTVSPKLTDGTNTVPGIAQSMQIALPGVPWQVKTFVLNYSDISVANPSWQIVWPFNSSFGVGLGGDSDFSDTTKPSYFNWTSESFQIAEEPARAIEIVHPRQIKGKYTLNTGNNTTPFDLLWTNASDMNFAYATTGSFVGSATIFLPKGNYNFKFVPEPLLSASRPAISVFPVVEIADLPVVENVALADGSVISGVITLANSGPAAAFSTLKISAQKRLDFGGYSSWLEVESLFPSLMDGSYAFKHKFVNGEEYRIVTINSDPGNSNPGLVDSISSPQRCYWHFIGDSFTVSTNTVKSFELPQAAGVEITFNVVNPAAAGGFALDSNSNPIQTHLVYLPELGSTWGERIWKFSQISNDKIFVFFVDHDKSFVVKRDYDEDIADLANPICMKVSAPIQAQAGVTIPVTVEIDPTNFVTVTSSLSVTNPNGGPGLPFSGTARALFTPLIPFNGQLYSAAQLMEKYFGSGYGLDNKVFNNADQQAFVYKAEKGSTFRIEAVEETNPKGLTGFISYSKDVVAPDQLTLQEDILVDEGRSFLGQVKVDGLPVAGKIVTVRINSIIDQESPDYGKTGSYISREGNVTTDVAGNFRVSGINPGRYRVDIILDQIDLNNINYHMQSMPFIRREIFVDESASSYPSMTPPIMPGTQIAFALNTSAIGWLDGEVLDEQGLPVADAMVEIRRQGEQRTDSYMPAGGYYQRGDVVFYCSTSQDGKIVRAAMASQPMMIPLESGMYDIFVNGVQNPTASYSYEFSTYESKPLATVQIYANNQRTPNRITLTRKFPVSGSVKEDGLLIKYMSFQVLDMNGKSLGYFMTDDKGEFKIDSGLIPGPVQFGMIVERDNSRRFYLHPVTIIADQDNQLAIELVSTALAEVPLQTVDSDGAVLSEAPGNVYLFSNPAMGFRAPNWYITWLQSDLRGNINLYLPQLTTEQAQAGWAYGFQGSQKWVQVEEVDSTGATKSNQKTYSPPPLTMLSVPASATTQLVWKTPTTVTVNVTGVPAGREGKYLGVLMTRESFLAGKPLGEQHKTMAMEGAQKTFFAVLDSDKFEFHNVVPGEEYVFLAYEALIYLNEDMVRWTPFFPGAAMFRHVSAPFRVDADLTRAEVMAPLADLTITCGQDPTLLHAVKIAFTSDAVSTLGNVGWPFIDGTMYDLSMLPPQTYPIQVPASYALRISYTPAAGAGFLAKAYENFIVPTFGRTLNLVINELPKVCGTAIIAGQPLMGQIVLVPEGADPMAKDFKPIRTPVNAGDFCGYLKPGFYTGYVVPMMGYAKYIELTVASVSQTLPVIDLAQNGHPVRGSVMASGTPLFGASVIVMRKKSALSDLNDGQSFLPYMALMGSYEVPCGPTGEFFFPAENGVDYYLQAVVPAGFNPGMPVKVPASNASQSINIVVGQGAILRGSMNVAGYVEAKPVGNSALSGQFGSAGGFYADASIPNPTNGNRFEFALVGLDPAMLYDITFWPMSAGYSYKKLSNVPVPTDPNAMFAVDLSDGFRITGQLVNAAGEPLNAANVSVNLAMTLETMAMTMPAPSLTGNLRVMQSVMASDPASYSMQDAMLSGMWTQTNEYGQFTFNNVPEFLVAFIKLENGFSADGANYGRTRTENFIPDFGTNGLMHFDVKVPVGGRIIGRLIDEAGKPVTMSSIEASFGQEWAYAMAREDGGFALEGLAPGSNYMVHLMGMPGLTAVFRSGILVEPGKTTDLGAITVAKAVMAHGMASGAQILMQNSFGYGMPEGTDLNIIAFDGNRALTDEDLLSGNFMQSITGESQLYFDPAMVMEEVGFSLYAKSGKTHLGVVLSRETDDGLQTLVSWGWRPGLVVPTQEQLEYGSFDITSGTPIVFPQKFGMIEGTLKHAIATETFNPDDAVIALYPVSGSIATAVLMPTPFPTALTRAVNGRWFIKDIPYGTYRIKVITRKYGTQFMAKIITIGDAPVTEDLALGTSVKRVYGKVLLSDAVTPVASAKVSLVLKNISTSTDANGNFSFYLPINELLIPQVEISKPGIQTVRFFDAGGIATSGIMLSTDQNLGNLITSGSVGRVDVTVKSGKDNNVYVGAEVALVYKESETVWTVGEMQTTDENGLARFLSVPTGREVSFRARAHYHVPTIATLTLAIGAAAAEKLITMPAASPKVFYTGILASDTVDPTKLRLKAIFDFNQVVVKNDVNLLISDDSRTADCLFPDLIGGRITNMMFNNYVPVEPNLVASVTYTGFGQIGRFDIISRAQFSREFEVDPLSQDGFTGRQTDAAGNLLPTGIAVPPGYLDPTIDSFNLEVASPTFRTGDLVEGGGSPEFAGPAFTFTFGQGQSNFGAGNHEGLFEITIAYTEGTKLEPRWYDVNTHSWSKVGIIQDSIRYDYPQKGYVTFKVSHLTEFTILKNVVGASSGYRCDFNDDGIVNLSDVVYMLSWYQLSSANRTTANVKTRALLILPSVAGEVIYLPTASIDDVNGDGIVNLSDVVMSLAWYQLSLANRTETGVKTRALSILGSITGVVTAMPGASITR